MDFEEDEEEDYDIVKFNASSNNMHNFTFGMGLNQTFVRDNKMYSLFLSKDQDSLMVVEFENILKTK